MALAFAALLPADHVPLPWLRALVAQPFPDLGRDAAPGYPDPWQALLRRLLGLRLLQPTGVRDAQGAPLVARIHRLVQEVVRLEGGELVTDLEPPLLAYIKERAKFLWDGWVQHEHRWELAPLTACADHWLERGGDDGPWLAARVAHPLLDLGNFAAAERLKYRALEQICPENPNYVEFLNNTAVLLQHTNRLAEAEPLLRQVVTIWENALGCSHPNVASAFNNLAALLKETNRLTEADELFRRALAIDEAWHSPNHPQVATDLNNLAVLLQDSNRLAEAELLIRRALAIDEAWHGPNHPNVATALNNLAELLRTTNRLAEAEPLYRRALAIDEASYGPIHRDVARDLGNLALLLWATNRLAEAEPLYRRALAIDEASYGPDHPDVAIRLNNLAGLMYATKRLAEAEPLCLRMVEIFLEFTRATRHEHPHLRASINHYAGLLAAMGWSQVEIKARREEMERKFGVSLVRGAYSGQEPRPG